MISNYLLIAGIALFVLGTAGWFVFSLLRPGKRKKVRRASAVLEGWDGGLPIVSYSARGKDYKVKAKKVVGLSKSTPIGIRASAYYDPKDPGFCEVYYDETPKADNVYDRLIGVSKGVAAVGIILFAIAMDFVGK